MNFFVYKIDELRIIINNCTYQELIRFTKYINDVAPGRINIKKISSTRKTALVDYLIELLTSDKNILNISKKLLSTEISGYLYTKIVWENIIFQASDIAAKFDLNFPSVKENNFQTAENYLNGILGLVVRATRNSGGYYYGESFDIVTMSRNMIPLLKIVLPVPDDFDLEGVKSLADTKYSYSNEE